MHDDTKHAASAASAPAVLDRVWQDLPYLPRAVALLIHFMEAEEAVGEMLRAEETELAAEVLAESYPVRMAFEAVYALPWDASRDLFAHATAYSVEHPRIASGDRVVYLPLMRVLYRLGYVDGLAGARFAPESKLDAASLRAPTPESAHEARAAAAIRGPGEELLNPAYEAGFAHGAAETHLLQFQPALLDAIDDRARLLLATGEAHGVMVGREIADVVHAREDDLDLVTIERGLLYAEGRALQVADARARDAVRGYLREESTAMPLGVGAVLRVLAQEIRRVGEREGGERSSELDDALLLAAGLGFVPATVADLVAPVPPQPPSDIVASQARDYRMADVTRRLLAALAASAPGRLWPAPSFALAAPGDEAREASADVASLEAVRALVRSLQNGNASGREAEEVQAWRRRLRRLNAPTGPAGELLALRALGEVRLHADADGLAYVRTELAARQADDGSLWGAIELRLQRRLAAAYAEALLDAWDASAARRSRAEAELARGGRDRDAELAEAWVVTYRAEAAGMGADGARLSWLSALPPSAPVAEGVLLLARARAVEAALDQRAWRAAQTEVARQVPVIGHTVYASSDAVPVIREVFEVAAYQAMAAAERLAAARPRFGARVLRHIPVAVLEALATEVSVVEEIEARECA